MEEILLSDKIKDYKIDFAERDADFHMDRFHYHPYYEIYFLLSGNCSALINHSIYHLVPGDFISLSCASSYFSASGQCHPLI